jgi:hypothetical protein
MAVKCTARTVNARCAQDGIRNNVEALPGYQISGGSQSGSAHGWKQFEVDQIRALRVLDRRLAGTRADSAQHHRTWDTLFARVM